MAWDATLYDLLSAYAALRLRGIVTSVKVADRHVFTLQEARDRLMRLIGESGQWEMLDSYFIEYLVQPELRATAKASAFSASLELVREGQRGAEAEPALRADLRAPAHRARPRCRWRRPLNG